MTATLKLTKQNLQQLFPGTIVQNGEVASTLSKNSRRSRSLSVGRRGSPMKPRTKSMRRRGRETRGRPKISKERLIKTIGPTVKSLKEAQRKMALTKSQYFDAKDSKTDVVALQKEIEQLTKEYQLLRNTLRAGLGDRPIRMRISNNFSITTTVTSGVTNTVAMSGGTSELDPSLCTEWSALAGLFDEYRCFGGEFVLNYNNAISFLAATVVDSFPVIGYDPDSTTSASSSLALTQLSQHKVLRVPVYASNLSSAPAECVTHFMKWHVPRGIANSTGAVVPGSDEWITCSVPQGAGYLRFYHLGAVVTAQVTGAGIVYFDMEFRCRA